MRYQAWLQWLGAAFSALRYSGLAFLVFAWCSVVFMAQLVWWLARLPFYLLGRLWRWAVVGWYGPF